MIPRGLSRRQAIRASWSGVALALGGCSGSPGAQPTTDTTTTSATTPDPRESRRYIEDFEDGPSAGWTGDVDAFERTTDAIRGSGAASLAPGFTEVHRSFPPTRADRYALWWKVAAGSLLRVWFLDRELRGFGFAVEPGSQGGIRVNPAEGGAVTLFSDPDIDAWYRLVFEDVDFSGGTLTASLRNAGAVELIRLKEDFLEPIEAVSGVAIENAAPADGGHLAVDRLEAGPGPA